MTCPKCGGQFAPGQALMDLLSGVPDFAGDDYVCTVSPSGRARLVECDKCDTCGYSKTQRLETDCECGKPTVFTRTGIAVCSGTVAKCMAMGVIPKIWLPVSQERPHPPDRHCLCPDCWPSFYDDPWKQT